jgi:hypothetical protein
MEVSMTLDDLLIRKNQAAKPIVVCLCGSTRFSQAFQDANLSETLVGRVILSIGINVKSDEDLIKVGVEINKEALDLLHLFKIDLADEILVLNVGGYIGDSTTREVQYAYAMGKHIRWLEPDKLCYCCQKSVTDEHAHDVVGNTTTFRFCETCHQSVNVPVGIE